MANTNILLAAPPYPVGQSLKHLGANLRTARLRRGLSMQEVAEKIGTGRRAVAEAEKGNASTGIAVYLALLWAFDLLDQMEEVADPQKDREGLARAASQEPTRPRRRGDLDNDF